MADPKTIPFAPTAETHSPPVLDYRTPRPSHGQRLTWAPAFSAAASVSIISQVLLLGGTAAIVDLLRIRHEEYVFRLLSIWDVVFWLTAITIVVRNRYNPTKGRLLWIGLGFIAVGLPVAAIMVAVSVLTR